MPAQAMLDSCEPSAHRSLSQATHDPLGRSAALVHAGSLLIAFFTTLASWLMDPREETVHAIVGVGFAAFLCGLLWSGLLAVRALCKGQSIRLSVAILALLTLEFTAPWLAAWTYMFNQRCGRVYESAYWLGFFVFVPLPLATVVGVLLARWRVRREDVRRDRAGLPVRAPAVRWKQGLAWYGAAIVLLAVPLMPMGAYLHGAWMRLWTPTWDVRFVLADATPECYRDAVVDVLGWSEHDAYWSWKETLLWSGHPSEAKICAEVDSMDNPFLGSALDGLAVRNPSKAVECALKLLSEHSEDADEEAVRKVLKCLVRHATADNMTELLEPIRFSKYTYKDYLCALLQEESRVDALDAVVNLVQSQDDGIRALLQTVRVLAHDSGRSEVVECLFAQLMAEEDPKKAIAAANQVAWWSAFMGKDTLLKKYLYAENPRVVEATLVGMGKDVDEVEVQKAHRWFEWLMPLTAHDSKHIRRRAAAILTALMLKRGMPPTQFSFQLSEAQKEFKDHEIEEVRTKAARLIRILSDESSVQP